MLFDRERGEGAGDGDPDRTCGDVNSNKPDIFQPEHLVWAVGGLTHLVDMANTYSQIYIQVVFAVEGRQNLILKQNKEELHKFMTGIVRERGQKLLAVHCMPDHTHVLIGLKPSMALSDLVRDLKNASTNFINGRGWVIGRFSWQEGFGAFSYGHSQLTGVIDYIGSQECHHARKSFHDEYVQFLHKFQIEHDEKYVFKPLG